MTDAERKTWRDHDQSVYGIYFEIDGERISPQRVSWEFNGSGLARVLVADAVRDKLENWDRLMTDVRRAV